MKRAAAVTRVGSMVMCMALAGFACEGDQGAAEPGESPPPSGTITIDGPGRWEVLPPLPEVPRIYAGVAAARGRVFVVGAYRETSEMVLVHAYDIASRTWESLAPLPSGFPMANAVGLGDRLFVLGGLENNRSVEYDFAARAWLPRAPLPVMRGRGSSAIGVQGTTVLLAGGVLMGLSPNMLTTGERVKELLAYDSKTDRWETWPELPVAAGYAMGAVVGNQFFVMGGSYIARTAEVLVFDLKARTWSTGVPLPVELSSAAVGVIGGKIIIGGGIASTTGMIMPDTLLFDPTAPALGWRNLSPITTPRFATTGVVVDNKLYVPTGVGVGPGGMFDFRPLTNFEVFVPGT